MFWGGCLLCGSYIIEVFCRQEQNTGQPISEYVRFPIAWIHLHSSTCHTDLVSQASVALGLLSGRGTSDLGTSAFFNISN